MRIDALWKVGDMPAPGGAGPSEFEAIASASAFC